MTLGGTMYRAPTHPGTAKNTERGDIFRYAEMTVGARYIVPLNSVGQQKILMRGVIHLINQQYLLNKIWME